VPWLPRFPCGQSFGMEEPFNRPTVVDSNDHCPKGRGMRSRKAPIRAKDILGTGKAGRFRLANGLTKLLCLVNLSVNPPRPTRKMFCRAPEFLERLQVTLLIKVRPCALSKTALLAERLRASGNSKNRIRTSTYITGRLY
jgi:hypothetical protein